MSTPVSSTGSSLQQTRNSRRIADGSFAEQNQAIAVSATHDLTLRLSKDIACTREAGVYVRLRMPT